MTEAAVGSVAAGIVQVSLKVFLALATGSLGVLSEALHSGLDLMAAVLTYLSVRVADRPADAEHPYGHGKVENFAALVEAALLMLTAVYVIFEAFHRLLFHRVHLRPSLMAVGVLGVAMAMGWRPMRCIFPPTSGARWWCCWACSPSGPASGCTLPGWPTPIRSLRSASRRSFCRWEHG